jgi:hypothetical protein
LIISGPKWAAPPLNWFRTTKKQQVKLVGKAAKQPIKFENFLLEEIRNFRQ